MINERFFKNSFDIIFVRTSSWKTKSGKSKPCDMDAISRWSKSLTKRNGAAQLNPRRPSGVANVAQELRDQKTDKKSNSLCYQFDASTTPIRRFGHAQSGTHSVPCGVFRPPVTTMPAPSGGKGNLTKMSRELSSNFHFQTKTEKDCTCRKKRGGILTKCRRGKKKCPFSPLETVSCRQLPLLSLFRNAIVDLQVTTCFFSCKSRPIPGNHLTSTQHPPTTFTWQMKEKPGEFDDISPENENVS